MLRHWRWNDVWTIKSATFETAAFAVLALYCVVQHLFAYNYAVGHVPYIPLMLGSYIYLSFLVSAAFLLRLVAGPPSPQVMNELAIPAAFFAGAILVVLLGDEQARSSRVMTGLSVMEANLRYLIGHTLAFAVGYSLRGLGRFKPLIVFGFVLLVVNALGNIDSTTSQLNLEVKDEDSKGIYIMLGDSFGLWALITCAVVESRRERATLVVAAVVILALLNSRTSLYAFLVTIPFIFRMSLARIAILILVMVAGIWGVLALLEGQEGLIDRMFMSVITGEDSSINSRMLQFEIGLDRLADRWFLGDYAGDVREFGGFGFYLHNMLSYWQQFGLLPFLLLLLLWGRAMQRARRCFASDAAWADPDLRFFVLGLVFFGFEILFSRSYAFPLQWLILGQSAALAVNPRYRVAAHK